jgi:hypothetical protein
MFVPHGKHLWTTTARYADSFTFLYVDDVCISQETHPWASMACYGDSFTSVFAMVQAVGGTDIGQG